MNFGHLNLNINIYSIPNSCYKYLDLYINLNQSREKIMPKTQKSDFQNFKQIGHGAFGTVYKAVLTRNKRSFALKKMSKANLVKQNMISQINTEIKILRDLKFEHIIKLYDCFEDQQNIYLVLQLAENGQLFDKLRKKGRFSQEQVKRMIKDVIAAVEYLHSQSPPIIHRDIKPQNLLLDKNDRIKLADFGWSNFSNKPRKTYCGTVDYLAPQMIQKSGHNQRLDIWCIGVLVYQLLTGRTPFLGDGKKTNNQQQIYENILNVRVEFPSDFPPQAKDFILGLIKRNPKQRMSFQQIKRHPWLREQKVQQFQSSPQKNRFQPVKIGKSSMQGQTVKIQQESNNTVNKLRRKVTELQEQITKYKVKQKINSQTQVDSQSTTTNLSKDQQIKKLYDELRRLKVAEQINEKYKKQQEKSWDEMIAKDKQIINLKNQLRKFEDQRSEFNQLRKQKQILQDKVKRLKKQLKNVQDKNKELEEKLEEANSGIQQRVKNGQKIDLQQVNSSEFLKYLMDQITDLTEKFEQSKTAFLKMAEKQKKNQQKQQELARLKCEEKKMRQAIRAQLRETYENQKDDILQKARKQLEEQRTKFFSQREQLKAMYEENGGDQPSNKKVASSREQDLLGELRNIKQLNKAYQKTIQKQNSQIEDLKQQIKRKK